MASDQSLSDYLGHPSTRHYVAFVSLSEISLALCALLAGKSSALPRINNCCTSNIISVCNRFDLFGSQSTRRLGGWPGYFPLSVSSPLPPLQPSSRTNVSSRSAPSAPWAASSSLAGTSKQRGSSSKSTPRR